MTKKSKRTVAAERAKPLAISPPQDPSADTWLAKVQLESAPAVRCRIALERAIWQLAEWQCAPFFAIDVVPAAEPRRLGEMRTFVAEHRPWLLAVCRALVRHVEPLVPWLEAIYQPGQLLSIDLGPRRYNNNSTGAVEPLRAACEADLVMTVFRDLIHAVGETVALDDETPTRNELVALVEFLGPLPVVDTQELGKRVRAELRRLAKAMTGEVPAREKLTLDELASHVRRTPPEPASIHCTLDPKGTYTLRRVQQEFQIPDAHFEALRGRVRRRLNAAERLEDQKPQQPRTRYTWESLESIVVPFVTSLKTDRR